MNYLRHLNGFFERLDADNRLSSYHISLYLALFRQWNASRFREQFVISRAETMNMARIGSANTYARCMKELAGWGYIRYNPSSNLHFGSTVSCLCFDEEDNPVAGTESGITQPTAIPYTPSASLGSQPVGIEMNTATGTASDTAADSGIPAGIKNDTSNDTATGTGNKTDTARSTASDTASNTGTSVGIKNDTASNTADDTGITSGLKSDTASGIASLEISPACIESDTGTDTASDTLLINNTNKNKQEENQKKENSRNKSVKKNDGETKENRKTDGEEKDRIPDFSEVGLFFGQNGFAETEASRFYDRYQSAGWKTGNDQPILSWQALARKWMTNNQKNKSHERTFNQIGAGRFGVPTDKDYSEPL